jgi:hypothetical protein
MLPRKLLPFALIAALLLTSTRAVASDEARGLSQDSSNATQGLAAEGRWDSGR